MAVSPSVPSSLRDSSRVERLAPWLAGVLIALPNLLAHYPPMDDLPLHEAVVGLLRHWGDARFVPPGVYELNFGPPNQLFYFLILVLSYGLSVTWATKVVVAATLLLLPVGCAKLADHLGVTRWAAVVLTPLGLGWMYFWGLLANMIALDLFLFALPHLDRFCEKPTKRGLAVVCAWALLLHVAHDMIALTAAGALCVFTVCRWRGARENLVRMVPVVLVLALALSARVLADHIKSDHARSQALFNWYSPFHKLITIPGALYGGYPALIRNTMCAVCFTPTLMFAAQRWKHRDPAAALRPLPDRLHDLRFEILGAALLASYFVAPVTMGSTTLIYHRFLPPAWILLALTAARGQGAGPPWRLPRLLAALVPLVPILTSWPKFAEADQAYTDLDAIIDRMDYGSTSILLELGPVENNALWSPVSGGAHVVARRGGRGFFDYTESPSSPVHIRTDRFWNEAFDRMSGHSYRFLPAYDLTRFRYAILHTPDPKIAAVVALAMQPEARVIDQIGDWTLMESTLPLVPIDAPDSLVPTPAPASLHERALRVADLIRGKAASGDGALPQESTEEPQHQP